MSDVPTHKLELTVSKGVAVINDWITGADDERIQAHYYNGGKVDKLTGEVNYSSEAMAGADHEAILAVVVSLNASTDNIVNRVLALPLPDFKVVMREVKKISNPLVPDDSQSSDETTPAI